MPKEKNYNPLQEHKKQEKQKQIKKQKATVQAQRNEKLARRNPYRIQKDIDDLKEREQSGDINSYERQRLQELETSLVAVNKARAALGDRARQFKPERRHDDRDSGSRGGQGGYRGVRGGALGKRTRDGQRKEEDSSDTDDDVRNIPMPRDTPPPIPRHRGKSRNDDAPEQQEPKKPTLVYEAAPEKRDFLKEATKFMPTAVANKMKLAKGEGRLLEPEEFDKLRDEGYMEPKKRVEQKDDADDDIDKFLKAQSTTVQEDVEQAADAMVQEAEHEMMAAEAAGQMQDVAAEATVAEKKLHHVEMEEVEDEDL